MFSLGIASLNVLMMLTVSMTVSHLYQNLELTSNLFKASEGVNYRDKRAKPHCVDAPSPPLVWGWESLVSIWQGRNMVYPGRNDPYFLAVILIPEPHFPQNFDA